MDKAALIQFTIAMFAILNPIGSVAIFAGLTSGCSPATRKSTILRSSIAIAVILIGSVWVGEHLLNLFGIGIPSLQVAGGIMIAQISLSMLHSKQSSIHQVDGDGVDTDIAVVPLAMPMVAGPGAIVTVIVNTHQHQGIAPNLEMSMVCGVLAGVICLCFFSTGLILRVLGARGMDILTKFMGMILLAIAVGMFATGLKDLLPGLAG